MSQKEISFSDGVYRLSEVTFNSKKFERHLEGLRKEFPWLDARFYSPIITETSYNNAINEDVTTLYYDKEILEGQIPNLYGASVKLCPNSKTCYMKIYTWKLESDLDFLPENIELGLEASYYAYSDKPFNEKVRYLKDIYFKSTGNDEYIRNFLNLEIGNGQDATGYGITYDTRNNEILRTKQYYLKGPILDY